MSQKKAPLINPSHYLLCCRFDNLLRLLIRNRPSLALDRLPQAALIISSSLLLFPFAVAESALFSRRIRAAAMEKDPVFIIGHWRSGTTYLQNILSRDKQFGWADPVSTISCPNCLLLRPVLAAIQKGPLKKGRPMDNMKYDLDLPMEDAFGLAAVSTRSIIHAISFPHRFSDYLPSVFIADMSAEEKMKWRREYAWLLKKLTYVHGGKQLVLKSPDNTGHLREILELYPNAKFINIYREPYTTLLSTFNMFEKQMQHLRISPYPDFDVGAMVEDVFLDIFERMYRELFELERELPASQLVSVSYEDFVAEPEKRLRGIYEALGLGGFDDALPAFREHIREQAGYKKNKFTLSDKQREKINSRMAFYFERYGYEMEGT